MFAFVDNGRIKSLEAITLSVIYIRNIVINGVKYWIILKTYYRDPSFLTIYTFESILLLNSFSSKRVGFWGRGRGLLLFFNFFFIVYFIVVNV